MKRPSILTAFVILTISTSGCSSLHQFWSGVLTQCMGGGVTAPCLHGVECGPCCHGETCHDIGPTHPAPIHGNAPVNPFPAYAGGAVIEGLPYGAPNIAPPTTVVPPNVVSPPSGESVGPGGLVPVPNGA